MITHKANYLIERAIIVFVCLWGNWALYYWFMVLIFDASLADLKLFSPLLFLQICASLFVFLRTDLSFSNTYSKPCFSQGWFSIGVLDKRFYFVSITAIAIAVTIVCAVHHYQLSSDSLTYNLVWALLLPISFFYLFYFKRSTSEHIPEASGGEQQAPTLDILLLILCTTVLAFNLYGTSFPTYDDGFYIGVISSTLANPDLPIQGRDFLLNTSAPFTLHPSYRPVGYEVLIAFWSDFLGIDPLKLYLDVFPTLSIILWAVAAYMFMRTVGVPYPGVAVVAALVALLFWNNGFSPGRALAFLCWGKNLLWLVGAPLLFVFVSLFMRSQSIRTWLLLLLAVCTTGIWSSSAVFVAPICVVLACLVFCPSITTNLRTKAYALLSTAPIFLIAIYAILMLIQGPDGMVEDVSLIELGRSESFAIRQDRVFGGRYMQEVLLVLLLLLPLVGRTVGNRTFQVNLFRICLVGVFTVMAPYLIEIIAYYTGTDILSGRFQYAYPIVLLVGVMASIVLIHFRPYGELAADTRARSAVIVMAVAFYGFFFGIMDSDYIFGNTRLWVKAFFESDFEEARAARALIPDGSFVAAGDMDDILPIFPNPPSFIEVKSSYLASHRNFLTAKEFAARKELFWLLQNRLPGEGKSLKNTLDWMIATSEELGVTSIVFHAVGGRHRPYVERIPIPGLDAQREVFVKALTARLGMAGYECAVTPSGRATVCNRMSGDPLKQQT